MAVNQVDAALALPAGETGAALLALPEDQWFDRKSVRILPKDLGAPLTAFANAEGGMIVIGLNDGLVEGCRQHPEKINSFRQAAIDFVKGHLPSRRTRRHNANSKRDERDLNLSLPCRSRHARCDSPRGGLAARAVNGKHRCRSAWLFADRIRACCIGNVHEQLDGGRCAR